MLDRPAVDPRATVKMDCRGRTEDADGVSEPVSAKGKTMHGELEITIDYRNEPHSMYSSLRLQL